MWCRFYELDRDGYQWGGSYGSKLHEYAKSVGYYPLPAPCRAGARQQQHSVQLEEAGRPAAGLEQWLGLPSTS